MTRVRHIKPREEDRYAAERWFARYGEPLPNDDEVRSLAAAFAEVRTEERSRCERALASAAIDERLLARLLEYLRCLGCEGEHDAHYAECPAVTVSLNEARRVRNDLVEKRSGKEKP